MLSSIAHHATFTVSAGDVDDLELLLRIARERRQLAWLVQPELGTKQAQIVQPIDGFGIGHV
jgi:hypothetical protein